MALLVVVEKVVGVATNIDANDRQRKAKSQRSGAGMGAAVGGDLGEDGVVMRANSRSKITSSLVVICRVLVVISRVSVAMVDRF